MTDVPWPVVLVIATVFVGFGVGLGAMGRGVEPWARYLLWAKGATWAGLGLGFAVSHWLPGVGSALFLATGAVRLALFLFGRRVVDRALE